MTKRPTVSILGAYRLESSDALVDEAMRIKYGEADLPRDEHDEAQRAVREELRDVILFEVLVQNRDDHFSVGDFGQPGSDQAAYDETYLSADGGEAIEAGLDVPDIEPLRLCFFLHFVDVALPLMTSYGQVTLPAIRPMSDRLRKLVPYEPVD